MGERKVLNKYYPPDFDPEQLPRNKCPKDRQVKVRVMLPFSLQCDTCGEYIYRGKKFNSRKEMVQNEDYLGIKIWRFYLKCTRCCSEITFKTDPQNADYICEHGATRNFEPWRQEHEVRKYLKDEHEEDEKKDVMKALENRTIESKREMEMMDALEALKERNEENATIDVDALLDVHSRKRKMTEAEVEAADEDLANSINFGGSTAKRQRLETDIETNEPADMSEDELPLDDDTAGARQQVQNMFAGAPSSALVEDAAAVAAVAMPSLPAATKLVVVTKKKEATETNGKKGKKEKKHKKDKKEKDKNDQGSNSTGNKLGQNGTASSSSSSSSSSPSTATTSTSGLGLLSSYGDDSD